MKQIFNSALKSVLPRNLINQKLSLAGEQLFINNHKFDLSDYSDIYIIGFGKASAYMAATLEDLLGDRISGGAVIVKYGHTISCRKVAIYEAGHPVPDKNTLIHSQHLLDISANASKDDLVFCLISGGGSSLFEILPQSIFLEDLRAVNSLLLSSGAKITEMNALRKHLSKVKGGQLLRSIYPATSISLIISDILHDPVGSIASGPTAPDNTTFRDAKVVVDKYALGRKLPSSVIVYLQSGVEGKVTETLKEGEEAAKKAFTFVIGNIDVAIKRAKMTAQQQGYEAMISYGQMKGEASTMGRSIAQIIKQYSEDRVSTRPPLCLIFGGETTVMLGESSGRGGRNQELALSALIHLKDFNRNFALISAGTDGTDGPTDAAGALITRQTFTDVKSLGLNPEKYLEAHDSYHFFETTGSLLKTGPTGTNVMDLVIALVE